MQLRSATIFLLLLALVLPVAQGVLYWVAMLLGAMQDAAGQAIVGRIVLVCGILWLIDLVALVIVLALQTLETRQMYEERTAEAQRRREEQSRREEQE